MYVAHTSLSGNNKKTVANTNQPRDGIVLYISSHDKNMLSSLPFTEATLLLCDVPRVALARLKPRCNCCRRASVSQTPLNQSPKRVAMKTLRNTPHQPLHSRIARVPE